MPHLRIEEMRRSYFKMYAEKKTKQDMQQLSKHIVTLNKSFRMMPC